MNTKEFSQLIENLAKDAMVKVIEVTDWKEMGEWAGEKPMPIMKITKYKKYKG